MSSWLRGKAITGIYHKRAQGARIVLSKLGGRKLQKELGRSPDYMSISIKLLKFIESFPERNIPSVVTINKIKKMM